MSPVSNLSLSFSLEPNWLEFPHHLTPVLLWRCPLITALLHPIVHSLVPSHLTVCPPCHSCQNLLLPEYFLHLTSRGVPLDLVTHLFHSPRPVPEHFLYFSISIGLLFCIPSMLTPEWFLPDSCFTNHVYTNESQSSISQWGDGFSLKF